MTHQEVDANYIDRFDEFVAVMIAVGTLIGAVLAWRISADAAEADDADFAGLHAVLIAEETRTVNDIDLFRHYRAYTHYKLQLELEAYATDESLELTAENLSDINQLFFPSRYLNRDGSYAVQREVGETWAQAQQVADLNPSPHFDQADFLRSRARSRTLTFILLAMSLFFFTGAEGLHRSRPRLRYGLGSVGLLLLAATIIMAIYLEISV